MEKQKSALITGCSEGGIGDALAQEFLKKGLRVFATARDLNSVQHLKELGCEVCRLDVTDVESVKSAVEFVRESTGDELGVLVNNAGTAYNSTVLDTDISMSKQQFEVNYWGVLRTTQLFFPLLRNGKGTVVNIGSAITLAPGPYTSSYRSTKVALEALSHAMRMEMEPFGLHVVHATLAFVDTRLQAKAPAGGNIPPNSLYKPIREKVEAYMKIFSPTIPVNVFAKRFVPQVLKRNPSTIIMDGGGLFMTRTLAYLASWFGIRTFDWVWGFVSGLPELRKMLREEGKSKAV